MKGFYYYYVNHSKSRQKRLFKFAFGRLARWFPDASPRLLLAEHLFSWIYDYEKFLAYMTHQRRLRDEPWTLEGDKSSSMGEEHDRFEQDLVELWDIPETNTLVDGTEIDLE